MRGAKKIFLAREPSMTRRERLEYAMAKAMYAVVNPFPCCNWWEAGTETRQIYLNLASAAFEVVHEYVPE